MLIAAIALSFAAQTAVARDPFEPTPFAVLAVSENPLERYEVHRMVVQGVIEGASPRALVLLPNGKTYIVKVGDPMGPNFGRIKSIRRSEITVVEEFRENFTMKRVTNEIVLALQAPTGE